MSEVCGSGQGGRESFCVSALTPIGDSKSFGAETEKDFRPRAVGEAVSDLRRRASDAARKTRSWLLDRQHADGHWCAELDGDTILESEYVLLQAFLGRERSERTRQAAEYLLGRQLPGGGWAMYPGGGCDVNGSVKAYFALKLTGHDPQADYMQRACQAIRAGGGADRVNSYGRFLLAMLGQISYDLCPCVPPELVLLPRWFPVHLDALSAWSRTIVVPLSIVSANRPVRAIEPERGIRELFLDDPERWPPLRRPGATPADRNWERFFRSVDAALRWCQARGVMLCRRLAIQRAKEWMLQRFQGSDGLGAIFPPIVWSIVALKSLGYADDSPEVRYCQEQLEDLVLEDRAAGTVRLQPCKSPVWDTAITIRALCAGGAGREEPVLAKAAQWLLDRQIAVRGDWSGSVRAEPAGWCFEYHNDFYPDVDDTIMVLMALRESCGDPDDLAARGGFSTSQAMRRGLAWTLAMQNDDGGWGAFDRNNNRGFLCHVPFADHNAMIDPSTPDLTGRALECLGLFGWHALRNEGHGSPRAAVARAVRYLRRSQEPEGCWYGRWGVNCIYGTWQVLAGLRSVGVPAEDRAARRGVRWLLDHQQPGGAWGESADSYEDRRLWGVGPPTASQTAWAVLGLLAAGLDDHPATLRGIRYLVETQQDDGDWQEDEFTGTGFPRVFYLRYHYYRVYFPLLALGRWLGAH